MTAPAFFWTPADSSAAGYIAVTLALSGHVTHSDVIVESSVELWHRAPRLLDAQRFQLAAARLFGVDSVVAARAAQLARRIALNVVVPAVRLKVMP